VNLLLTPLSRAVRSRTSLSAAGAPSHIWPSSRQRRWFREAEEPVVEKSSPPRQLSRGAGSHEPSDRCNRVRSASTTSNRASPAPVLRCAEVALGAWRWTGGVPSFGGGSSRASAKSGAVSACGPIRRRAFTIARERSGATPIRLTRTPSVADSWEKPGGEPSAPGERCPQRARPGCPGRVRP